MGFENEDVGSGGYECQCNLYDLHNNVVSKRFLEPIRAYSLPLVPLAPFTPLDWPFTPFTRLSPFSAEGHMLAGIYA